MKTLLLLLALMAAHTGGCKPPIHHDPPETVGERTNQQGVVIQRIVRDRAYTSEMVPLTPDGPRKKIQYQISYFMEEPGKLRHELPVMLSADFENCGKYYPVEGTSSWLALGIDPVGNRDKLYYILFDERRIIHKDVFSVVPKWKSEKDEYELQDRNCVLILRTPGGLEKYDVLTGKVLSTEK